ncbi:MAG: hypothetical protein EZS28_028985 [Streblomastix strix]|uniref:Uncharacterized protein n=1 Tax=Streblomastix strix TaxID=222440 RepID=A0A5J4UYB8_9EUKA|nr:MAG: hypothetical protein EZS28_028985 [Streblomastix strix]
MDSFIKECNEPFQLNEETLIKRYEQLKAENSSLECETQQSENQEMEKEDIISLAVEINDIHIQTEVLRHEGQIIESKQQTALEENKRIKEQFNSIRTQIELCDGLMAATAKLEEKQHQMEEAVEQAAEEGRAFEAELQRIDFELHALTQTDTALHNKPIQSTYYNSIHNVELEQNDDCTSLTDEVDSENGDEQDTRYNMLSKQKHRAPVGKRESDNYKETRRRRLSNGE